MPSALRDDLFVIACTKEVAWPYQHADETERLVQDSSGQLFRLVQDTPRFPFAAANECLATFLAKHLGLSTPAGQPVRFDQAECYGERFEASWWPFDHDAFLRRNDSAELAGSILAFDFWLCNPRRTEASMLMDGTVLRQHYEAAQEPGHELPALPAPILIRHQRCFMGLYDAEDEAEAFDPIPPDVESILADHPLTGHIHGQFDFHPFLTRLEAMDAEQLRDMIRRVPSRWLTPGHKAVVFEYLRTRASQLRGMINQLRPFCPDWR